MRESPKTLLQLTAMYSLKFAGLERYLLEVARSCRGRGYRTVFQYESLPESPVFIRHIEDANGRVVVAKTLANTPGSIAHVAGVLRRVRPRIVHAHFQNALVLFVLPYLCRLFGIQKLLATVHSEIDPDRMTCHRRIAYNHFDHVLPVSQAVTRSVLAIGVRRSQVSTHYLGVFSPGRASHDNRERYRHDLGIAKHTVLIGCIAHDAPVKGVDVLLDATELVLQDGLPIELMIVGLDRQRSTVSQRSVAQRLGRTVHWLGIKDEGWRYLAAADLYVQPSRAEGVGLAVMEAMALGLPIVASRVVGIPEAVVDGETGLLVEPGNPRALAAAIKHLLVNPAQRRAMGDAACARHEQFFSGERSVRNLIANFYGIHEEH